jgi:hypothetical protein
MNVDIEKMVKELSGINLRSKSPLVQEKTKRALSKIKQARSLLENAEGTLLWAQNYKPASTEI